MVDPTQILDNILKYAVAPLGAFIWWLFKKYDMKIESLEIRMHQMEKETVVLATKMDSLKEDMTEIKATLNTLITMLQNRKNIQ